MRTWDLTSLDIEVGHPEVLHTAPGGRAIALRLSPSQGLPDHEVHEDAWLLVAEGRVRVRAEGGEDVEVGPGGLAVVGARERRDVSALEDARVLLLLTPWPAADRPEATA